MDAMSRIERALDAAVRSTETPECPPKLAAAMRYTVFPGGARIRPKLCIAVAYACGDDDPHATDAAAASIELMHCASLVHDDLPCFDDADMRRGKPTVHLAFNEQIAVLTGDALIVLAFETLARGLVRKPKRLGALVSVLGQATGAPAGICAGQAWESESFIDLVQYHQAKTGALFAAATMAGAAAAGHSHRGWNELGQLIGSAYQVADDIRDVAGSPEQLGKPVGRDAALARPSAAREMGLKGAVCRLRDLVESAIESIPDCPRRPELRQLIQYEASRFLPKEIFALAA